MPHSSRCGLARWIVIAAAFVMAAMGGFLLGAWWSVNLPELP